MDKPWLVYFDGGCQPTNPGGTCTYGCVLYDPDGVRVAQEYGCISNGEVSTNNIAELSALVSAIELAVRNKVQSLIVRGDSQLAVYTTTGIKKLKKRYLIPIRDRARKLLESIPHHRLEWIPREENCEADRLSNRAYQEYLVNKKALKNR